MSHIRHYRVLPSAMGPLTSLESIAEVQTGKSLKLQIVRISEMLENPERSGTERNGTEPEVIDARRCWTRGGSYKTRNGTERNWKPDTRCVNVSSSRYGELILRPVPATKTGQASSRQYRAIPSVLNILAVYLVSSSGVTDPSLTSEGLAMSLPSLGSAVGSRFTRGSPWNRKGMVSLSVLSTKYETSITTERPLSC